MSKPLRHTPPYSQQYRFIIPEQYVGQNIIDFFTNRFSFKPRDYWLQLLANQQISVNNQGVDQDYVLQRNDLLHTRRDDVTEPDVNADFKIIHDADGVFVINKPAPLPVHPVGRYYKNSLIYILDEIYPDRKFHTIHRIDVWTTGVLVMGSDPVVAKYLHRQVEKQRNKKIYAVLAKGDFGDNEFVADQAIGRVEGAHRGVGPDVLDPKQSKTIFTPLAKNGDVTLLRAEPVTGRTNQIRVHIQACGGHILNDPLYSPLPSEQQEFIGLHCRDMRFSLKYPDEPVSFKAEWPEHYRRFFSEDDLNRVDV